MDLKRITLECIGGPISLSIEENEYFAIDDSDIDIDGASDTYYINLIVLKDIVAPFDKTLDITAVVSRYKLVYFLPYLYYNFRTKKTKIVMRLLCLE